MGIKPQKPFTKTSINKFVTYEGESIEARLRRVTLTKEPIKDSTPMVYTYLS